MKSIKKIFVTCFFLVCFATISSFAQQDIKFKFNNEGKFKIVQFTDLHWIHGSSKGETTKATIQSVLESEKPDVAILTGDVAWKANAGEAWTSIIKIFEEAKMPFAVVFGNHDSEPASGISRPEIMDILLRSPYFVGEKGPKDISGCGNYVLPVSGSKSGKTAAVLYCLDSNDYTGVPKLGTYSPVHFNQVMWYRQQSDNFTRLNNGKPLPSLAFFHIPLQEYNFVANAKNLFGTKGEDIAASRQNTGLFTSFLDKKDVMGVFVGHDHDNDYIGQEAGIALAFGRVTGEEAYGNLVRGGRIIELKENDFVFDTWIRTPSGSELLYHYPEGVPEKKEVSAPQKITVPVDDGKWKAEANARIEKHRKEDVLIRVTQNGKPVKDAKVEIKMLENEFLFGSNIFQWEGSSNEAENLEFRRQYAGLLNFATLGFYWGNYERERGKPNYAASERVAAWCAENGIRAKGHPLVYNSKGSNPAWISNMDDDELFGQIQNRVAAVAGHFRGSIDTWDVINETVYWTVSFPETRLSRFGTKFGPVALAKASFESARKANPDATLILNDNNFTDRFSSILSQMTDTEGKPLYDVIGVQSHFHMDAGRWDNERIWEVCERFSKFGKPIHFTEMTILSTVENCKHCDNVPTSTEGEQWQRDEVVRVYTMLFSHPAVEAITWWDFSDQNSWLGAPSGLVRKDMTPKPAYNALKKLIKEDWATNTSLTSDKKGEVSLRAFRGKYSFTVTLPNGQTVKVFSDTIKKGENVINLKMK